MHSLGDTSNFADKLVSAVMGKRSHVVVGLDPHFEMIPPALRRGVRFEDPANMASIIEKFCIEVIEVVADLVPAVKPQVAFFERLGAAGFDSLQRVVHAAHRHGLLVISDAKRGDIGSTAAAYAEFHIGFYSDDSGREHEGLGADAMTVNAYLGSDSLEPYLKFMSRGKGIFVLAKTSNPASTEIQDRLINDNAGRATVYETVADLANKVASRHMGQQGFGSVGIVVGATHPEQAFHLRSSYPHLYFLVPGYGAQGGTAKDVASCFDQRGLGAIVNASRSILFAYRDSQFSALNPGDWAKASRQATIRMRDEINAELSEAGRNPW